MTRLRSLLIALAWLTIAILVATGAAGVATMLNPPPVSGARPELTRTGDRVAAQALDAATVRLGALSDAVDALGRSSRQALASLAAGDADGLAATLAAGTDQLAAVTTKVDELQVALAAVPSMAGDGALRVSPDTIARYQALAEAPALTRNLEADWTVLSARAMAASVLPDLLARHDRQTAAAARQGGAGHYAAALSLLDASDSLIVESRGLRDRLSQNADVTTLSQWIDRLAAYDAALRQLYAAMIESRGRVTSAVRAAFAAQQAAKVALPADTRGIVVIMGDIARGGLNQAVIDIEVARGSLAALLAAQPPGQGGPPPPTVSAAPAIESPAVPGTAAPQRSGTTPPP